jgi:hypothetical protein
MAVLAVVLSSLAASSSVLIQDAAPMLFFDWTTTTTSHDDRLGLEVRAMLTHHVCKMPLLAASFHFPVATPAQWQFLGQRMAVMGATPAQANSHPSVRSNERMCIDNIWLSSVPCGQRYVDWRFCIPLHDQGTMQSFRAFPVLTRIRCE